jgi:hypothetical protein
MGGGDGTPLQEVVGRELAQLRLAGKRTEKSLESTTMNIPPVTGILMSVLLVSSGALAGAEAAKPLPLATRGQAAVYTIVRPAQITRDRNHQIFLAPAVEFKCVSPDWQAFGTRHQEAWENAELRSRLEG